MSERGNADRMARLVREYGERAYRCACRLTGNTEKAEDLVQEAYRRVLVRWKSYDPGQPLENWFFSVLRNLYIDAAKREERCRTVSLDMPVRPGDEDSVSYAELLPSQEEELLAVLEREESCRTVREAMAGMSYEHRAILGLCDMEGLSYEEIARVLEVPIGTIRSRISRARRSLKRRLLGMQEV